jgi:hypothetical protein
VGYLQTQPLEWKRARTDGTLGAKRRAHRRRGQFGVAVRRGAAASWQPTTAATAAATERRLRPHAHAHSCIVRMHQHVSACVHASSHSLYDPPAARVC